MPADLGDDEPPVPDARVPTPGDDAAPEMDALVKEPVRRCDPEASFDSVEPVAELNMGGTKPGVLDEGARLSQDELTVYFSSNRNGASFQIYMATRADPSEMFGEPVEVPGVNTTLVERNPTLTADGLSIFATQEVLPSSPDGVANYQVVGATRPDAASDFGPLEVLQNVNRDDFADIDPYVLSDGRALYFASTRTGGVNGADLYRSARTDDGFDPPSLVEGTNLNATSFDEAPVVTDDELRIYYASNASDNHDIYVARRANVSEPFNEPVPIPELTTGDLEWPTWISPDGCVLYFARGPQDNRGYDIYVARRGM